MKRAVIYVRLSKEDTDKISMGDDSESIKNQRNLLTDYAMKNGYQIVNIYSDDDFGGSDMDRPAWNEMLEDAKNKEFDVILCKTQSRFARSLEVVEKYVNGLFLEWGIQFISIIDGIDNLNKSNRKTSQINGLVDQWYIEDMSANIRTVFKKKMKDGQFLGAFAPYGYEKDPKNKYSLIVDEEAAKNVKRIYELYIKGYGVRQICKILTSEKIPTPTQYKAQKGYNYKNPNSSYSKSYGSWGATTVKNILSNKTYLGYLCQGRSTTASYKSKKVITIPESDWVMIKDVHVPIIDTETFYDVQEQLNLKRVVSNNKSGIKKAHLFAGKVFCLDCDSTMVKSNGNEVNKSYLRCSLAVRTNKEKCSYHSIRFSILSEAIVKELKPLISNVLNNKHYKSIINNHFVHLNKDDKTLNELYNKKHIFEKDIVDKNKALQLLYYDKASDIIENELFLILREKILEDTKIIINSLNEINTKINKNDSKKLNTEILDKLIMENELTNVIVNQLIKKIYIGEKDSYGGRKIKIEWNF